MAPKKLFTKWSAEELDRIYELRFRQLMHKFFEREPNPTKMIEFIDMLAYLYNLNRERLKAAAMATLDDYYMGIRKEEALAMYQQNVPVMKICKRLQFGPKYFYEILKEWSDGDLVLVPRYNSNQTKEIIKLMTRLEMLLDLTD